MNSNLVQSLIADGTNSILQSIKQNEHECIHVFHHIDETERMLRKHDIDYTPNDLQPITEGIQEQLKDCYGGDSVLYGGYEYVVPNPFKHFDYQVVYGQLVVITGDINPEHY
ncbi:hypothetical protein ABEY63_25655 [Priestia aryabhattai]|uniref:hypothetical protein n=1 Tax=Priestia aryabhattai TaxID=412384 RepID=UPI003D2DF1DC